GDGRTAGTGAYAAAIAGTAIAALLAALLVSGCGGGDSSSAESVSFDGAAYPNGDAANSRRASGPIKAANVAELEQAWSLPLTAQSSFGAYASTPAVSNGVLYSQDLESNVQAIELESGDVLWTKKYEFADQGPNGVVAAGGRVYGGTATSAFALDRETGKQLWSVQLTRNEQEGIDMAPGYANGMVFISTVPWNAGSYYEGGAVGTLWALDAKSGKKLWHFDTVPRSLWGEPSVNAGGGLWYTPAFDGKGSMYFGVGNPAPFPGSPGAPWGSSRPGPNLYTDSIVKMDAKTGKMDWYFQLTPHDLYDWDLEGPPMLMNVGGRELVVAGGKSGFVIALDARSGKLVWKRAVGKHNGHDEDGLLAMQGETSKLKPPFEVSPGTLGGVIAPMSTDGSRVFVPVVNHPVTVGSGGEIEETSPENSGELVALNVKDGSLVWKHEFAGAPAFGATTVSNDVVFATTFDGKVNAYEAQSGRQLWQEQLPAGSNAGVTISGDMVIAPAGLASAEGQTPQIVAYRLGG
ncbi:MAG TPA: PQQ-binding-like beta-propeller repeat protein, partial [Solirubrobacterales bacterium]|nr:PQQ-binding-like beta-propeller repeat protein [Solirubrobacterales bacterium]